MRLNDWNFKEVLLEERPHGFDDAVYDALQSATGYTEEKINEEEKTKAKYVGKAREEEQSNSAFMFAQGASKRSSDSRSEDNVKKRKGELAADELCDIWCSY